MKKIIILLGADNVGKTTIINNSFSTIKKYMPGTTACYKHFSAPLPGDAPLKQFYDYKSYLEDSNELTDYIYIDRAWPEARFYETFRRGNDNISINDCLELESDFLDFAKERGYSPAIYLIYKPWLFIEKFHMDELLNNTEFTQESARLNGESLSLNNREKEHAEYYLYMLEYMDQRVKMSPDVSVSFPMNMLTVYNLDFNIL